jgi:proline racemase
VILSTVEMHTGGEPTRIIVDGWPEFVGKTLLDKRREAKERFDHLRRGLMLEPRGHDGMYGALLVEPDHPEADLAVLFMHNEGFSTMCGHATIALARWAVDSGRVARREPGTIVRLQCPCGLVTAHVAADGTVRFESVPAFAYALDRIAPTRTGRHRLWWRLLRDPCRRFDRTGPSFFADARHRRCRRGGHARRGCCSADRARR